MQAHHQCVESFAPQTAGHQLDQLIEVGATEWPTGERVRRRDGHDARAESVELIGAAGELAVRTGECIECVVPEVHDEVVYARRPDGERVGFMLNEQYSDSFVAREGGRSVDDVSPWPWQHLASITARPEVASPHRRPRGVDR